MYKYLKYLLIYVSILAAIKTGEALEHVSLPKVNIEVTQYSDGDKFRKCGFISYTNNGSSEEECWTREVIKAYPTYVVYNLITASGFKLKTKALMGNSSVESNGWEKV